MGVYDAVRELISFFNISSAVLKHQKCLWREDYCSIVISPVLRGKPVALNTSDGLIIEDAVIILPEAPKYPAYEVSPREGYGLSGHRTFRNL